VAIKKIKMKKTIIVLLLAFYGLSLNAQKPTTFNLRFGDSEIKGLFGTEFQVSRFSLSAGWRPVAKLEGETLHSFCGALTIYEKQNWQSSSLYFSIGGASKGYLYSLEYPHKNYTPEPALILLGGRRFNIGEIVHKPQTRLMIDVGIGCRMSEHNVGFTFEFVFTYSIFNNSPKPRYR